MKLISHLTNCEVKTYHDNAFIHVIMAKYICVIIIKRLIRFSGLLKNVFDKRKFIQRLFKEQHFFSFFFTGQRSKLSHIFFADKKDNR